MKDNIIYVKKINHEKANLEFNDIKCAAFLGKNGITANKIEGDKKTPIGEYKLGLVLGFHDRDNVKVDKSVKYIKITDSMYWVCDVESEFYNQLVDCKFISKNWNEAEHLIDYKIQYEYLVEIKANPNNIPKKGSAIFLHCSIDKPTDRLCINR